LSPLRRSLYAVVPTVLALLVLSPSTAVRAEPSAAEIQQRINTESRTLSRIVEDYNKVREQLKQTKAAAARHAATLPALEQRLGAAERDIQQIALTAYKTGHLREVDALLSAGRQGALLDRLSPLDQLAKRRQEQVRGYAAARQQYLAEKRKLDNLLAKQNIQMRDLAARKVKIEKDLEKLFELRRQAYGQAQETGSRYTGTIPAISGSAGVAVRFAYNAIGSPYVWGAAGPNGYDCSGLTKAAWRAAGKSLPHNAAMQRDATAYINQSQLMPGDLVFYSGLGHVGLYVGNGKVIHAPTFGQNVTLADVGVMPIHSYGRVR